jgi:hypothetical protein
VPHYLSSFKNNSKNLRKSPHDTSPFSIKNNFENSSSMSHHISLLKNNSKNPRKSPHTTSPFSM